MVASTREIGSMTPSVFEIKYCALGRDEIGMVPKCEATSYNGRCWQERQEQQE